MRNPSTAPLAAGLQRTFALDHLTAIEATPAELVETAALAGYPRACAFVRSIDELGGPTFDLSREPTALRATRTALAATGVTLDVAYPFTLSRRSSAIDFRPHLEVAAGLGARFANVLVYLRDESAILDQVAAFCEEAERAGLGVAIEMVPATAIKTLPQAAALSRAVTSSTMVGVNLDLLHLYRSGSSPAEAADFLDAIVYAQVCDGPLARPEAEWREEAAAQRARPGDGEQDVRAFLDLLADVPTSVEVPDGEGLRQGISPALRASAALAATYNMLK